MTLATSMQDQTYMQRALELARQGLATTFPNPRVGCVVVKNNQVVGEAYHRYAGEAHAEILALEQAGSAAQDASLYVTLEPCCHYGRTPPCCDRIIQSGIRRVVAAVQDPSKKVDGHGLKMLQEHGIEVVTGVLSTEAIDLNCGFFSLHQQQRPWIRIKSAMTLDGRIAHTHGAGNWVSSQASRRDVQFWRARSDVLLTSSGTVKVDDPQLTVRLLPEELGISKAIRQPLRVVVDSHLKTSLQAKIYRQKTVVATCSQDSKKLDTFSKSLEQAGGSLWQFEGNQAGRVPLDQLFQKLGHAGCLEVQVEAGAGLVGALLSEELCDELLLYQAPVVYGRGPLFLDGERWQQSFQNLSFTWKETKRLDQDLRLRLAVKQDRADV